MSDSLVLRTRPTTVEARRLTEDNQAELARWVDGWTFGVNFVRWFDRNTGQVLSVERGDWIVRTAFGEHQPVKDSVIFSRSESVLPVVSE